MLTFLLNLIGSWIGNETIYTYLHSQFIYDIKVYKQYLDNLFHGLNYLGIEKILKQLVEESNEKI